jgi:dipeptidyl aminopeptidase/acylaminoacyl peptidase
VVAGWRWITFGASPTFPDEPGFHTDIWIMRADGSHQRQLTRGGFDVEPVFSPDGRRIAFGRITNDAEGEVAIYVVGVDGRHLREVVPPTVGLEHPDWSRTAAGSPSTSPPKRQGRRSWPSTPTAAACT